MLTQICSNSQSTHAHTQQCTWLALSPAFLTVFPLSFPDLVRSRELTSTESDAGRSAEKEIASYFTTDRKMIASVFV